MPDRNIRSKLVSLAKSPTGRLLSFIYAPAPPTSMSTHGAGAPVVAPRFIRRRRLVGERVPTYGHSPKSMGASSRRA